MSRTGLAELEAVEAVARRGSFRGAARELSISASALSHAVGALEARLGVRLFNRTTRSVALTEAGEDFLAAVSPALSAIRGAVEAADRHRDTPAGLLRINSSRGAAEHYLMPIVLAYCVRYPDVRVELVTDDALIDIVRDGYDLGVRPIDATPADMIALPLGPEISIAVVASPAYFAGRDRPRHPHDLMAHACIRARMPSGEIYRWEFDKHGEHLALDVPGPLILDAAPLMYAAAMGGAGITHLPGWRVAEDLAAGRLVRVLEDWSPRFSPVGLYHPSRRHQPAKLRAFLDLAREMRRAG
jgi:DNA-binding transcriptional LysR family regulator